MTAAAPGGPGGGPPAGGSGVASGGRVDGSGVAPAAGLSQLGAEAERARPSYGEGALIMCDRLVRIYAADGIEVQALQGLDLLIADGELTAIVGASGSGKSTLMNILAGLDAPTAGRARVAGHDLGMMTPRDRLGYRRATVAFLWQQTARNLLPYLTARQNVIMPMRFAGLDRPTSGHLQVAGRDVTRLTERERLALRRSTVAFIFQSFGLIPTLSAAENVGIPLRITGTPSRQREERVATMLAIVGLAGHAAHRPGELSGGQQQRIAIARALAGRPDLLIADEPTSQLDLETGRQIMRLLLTVVRSEGITALVATHDEALMDLADDVLRLEDGRVIR